jgi:hypothetical protein
MKGWTQESKRHSLARQGVKTGRKITSKRFGLDTVRDFAPKYKELFTKRTTRLLNLQDKLDEGDVFDVFSVKFDRNFIDVQIETVDGAQLLIESIPLRSGSIFVSIVETEQEKYLTEHDVTIVNDKAGYSNVLDRIETFTKNAADGYDEKIDFPEIENEQFS